ncbi:calcium-transporting ATPase sarcoplasmic/endoplasmic reticulum type [Cajanus cajan]|uniref:calcium-transporting ATPase sarcoplasmic/endoplasmic reticulum type n=1 Tax=Cajanus cajan TaxID=3821 RepID=UPI0010FAEEAA|nr:calcium-transporting ATPase sarcoplasmic/endoplasmic reticulum type [Cajanus cajan]
MCGKRSIWIFEFLALMTLWRWKQPLDMNIRVLRTGMEGFFSILPATDLVPGNIVEVSVRRKVPSDKRMIEMLSNQVCVDQAILPAVTSALMVHHKDYLKEDAVDLMSSLNGPRYALWEVEHP